MSDWKPPVTIQLKEEALWSKPQNSRQTECTSHVFLPCSIRIRRNCSICTMPISEAVEQAIRECIEEDILAEFLTQNRAGGILGRGMGRRQTIRYKGRRRERKIVRQTGTSKGTDSKEIAKENVGFWNCRRVRRGRKVDFWIDTGIGIKGRRNVWHMKSFPDGHWGACILRK